MALKYSKIFTIIGAITCEPVTILVDYVEAEGFSGICIASLEGEYPTAEEFGKASNRVIDDKIYNFIPLTPPDTRLLVDALNGALEASEEGLT